VWQNNEGYAKRYVTSALISWLPHNQEWPIDAIAFQYRGTLLLSNKICPLIIAKSSS
jgi:hypothetical protein